MRLFFKYFATLPVSKIVLWCYLIWYLVTLWKHFDAAPAIWINSLGIGLIIGTGLLLGVNRPKDSPADHWQTARLFLTPFCVSSFAALIKGHDFLFVFPTVWSELALSLAACGVFLAAIGTLRILWRATRQR